MILVPQMLLALVWLILPKAMVWLILLLMMRRFACCAVRLAARIATSVCARSIA